MGMVSGWMGTMAAGVPREFLLGMLLKWAAIRSQVGLSMSVRSYVQGCILLSFGEARLSTSNLTSSLSFDPQTK